MRFISENINDMDFQYGYLNLIISGTGTGKTEFIRRELLNRFPDVKPSEVLYVTSRSLTRDQQSMNDGISKLHLEGQKEVIEYWNGATLEPDPEMGIWLMNYWQLTQIMDSMVSRGSILFSKIKIAVFDECHAIYSDRFIKEMIGVRIWLQHVIHEKRIMLIGLTATPNIIFAYENRMGILTHVVNKEAFVNYKAKNLICTRYECIPDLFDEGILSGVSIVMCNTFADCKELQKKLSHSVALCSANNKMDSVEMRKIRNYIINNQTLPPKKQNGQNLRILITTTTMREGINLIQNSEIKNVISCVTDELHVKQFVGRCRFNVENLVVAYHPLHTNANDCGGYLTESRRAFRDYIIDPSDRRWFDSIKDVLDCKFEDIIRYKTDVDFCGFYDEFDKQYCSTPGNEIKVFFGRDKDNIVSLALKYNLLNKPRSKYSFNAVVKALSDDGKYVVKERRSGSRKDNRQRYKVFYRKEIKNDEPEAE